MNQTRRLVLTLYATALLQGVALVSFPAAANLLQSPDFHGLTASQYGSLFLPMFVVAAGASFVAGRAAGRLGLATTYRAGVSMNALGMALFALTAAFLSERSLTYALLLLAIGAEGFGFGVTTTALNGHVQRLFPRRSARALTALHASLGVGTALPPLLLPLAVAHGGFAVLPATVAVALLVALVSFGPGGRFAEERTATTDALATACSPPLLPIASAAAIYGFAEAVLGNWGVVFLHEERGLSLTASGALLGAFWASITGGRLFFAALGGVLAPLRVFAWLPLLLGVGLALAAHTREPALLALAFTCAGLGGSAMLPLSFEVAASGASHPERRSGLVFALFLSGSALGSFGLGVLHERGLSLGAAFALSPLLALLLALAARWSLGAAPVASAELEAPR